MWTEFVKTGEATRVDRKLAAIKADIFLLVIELTEDEEEEFGTHEERLQTRASAEWEYRQAMYAYNHPQFA